MSPDRSPRRLLTEIHVEATPEQVWQVLTDLEGFAAWNPFIVEASGEVVVGRQIAVEMHPPGGRAVTFRPTVTVASPPEVFEWLGKVGVRGVFDGRHRFALDGTDDGTRVTQSEEFRGLLAPVLWRSLETGTRAGFELMNEALKRRVEMVGYDERQP